MPVATKPPADLPTAPVHPAAATIKPFSLNELKHAVARLERAGPGRSGLSRWSRLQDRVVSLGIPTMDTHLPWGGLPRGALHEIAGEGADREQGAAAAGFAAFWLAKLQAAGPVLWILRAAARASIDLYAPGLSQQGLSQQGLSQQGLVRQRLDPDRLILVSARRDDEALWAMEEGLKSKGLGAVIAEIGRLDLTASRRLQLAAETSGVTAFALRRWRLMTEAEREARQPVAAMTRWRVTSLPGGGALKWQVRLARCRGGRPAEWMMEQADGSDLLHAAPLSGDLAEALVDRSLETGAAKRQVAG